MSVADTADLLAFRREQGCHGSTLATEASAVSYGHKLSGTPDPAADFRVRQLLAGSRRLRPSADCRLAVSLTELGGLCAAVDFLDLSPLDRAAFRAVVTQAFFAMLRPGEVVRVRDATHTIRLGHVRLVGP